MKTLRNKLAGLLTGAALAIASAAYAAQPGDPFQVNPGAVGEPNGSFTSTFIDFSYVALVDQNAVAGTGNFTEQGGGFFGSFRHPTLPDVLTGTGINENYKLYLLFDAAGTVAPSGTGGLDVTFTNFVATLWVDKNLDTTIVASGIGAPDGTVAAGGITADDIQVGQTTTFVAGEAHIFPGLAAGDFDVLAFFEPVGGFFSGPIFLGFTLADANGVNTSLQGFSTGSFVDGRIDGSGNLSFVGQQVPEPSALILLGLGLVGSAAWVRRRSRNTK